MDIIINELISLKDEKYKKFNKKLCPDTNLEMLGIRVPVLRKFAQKIVNSNEYNWKSFIENKNINFFEEVQLKGFIIGYKKMNFDEKLKFMEEFIPEIDSWAITDSFIPTLKIKKENLKDYWNFILRYIESDKEFEVRFAVVSMLDYFIIDEYVDEVIKVLNNISHDGYYVKMSIAWTLAEIGIKYNDKAMELLKGKNNLDKFTYNKTLQKMIESFRIEDAEKERLRKMKIRDNKD